MNTPRINAAGSHRNHRLSRGGDARVGPILLRSGGVPGQNPGFSLCRIPDHGDRSTTAGARLLDRIATHHPRAFKARADSGYKNTTIEHAAIRGIDLEVVHRTPGNRTFTVQLRR